MIKVQFKKNIGVLILSGFIATTPLFNSAQNTIYANVLNSNSSASQKSSIDWQSQKLLPIKSKAMLIQILKDKNFIGKQSRPYEDYIEYDVAPSFNMNEAATNTEKTLSTDYTTTNVQVDGIDEADIIKNDGRYIYLIKEQGQAVSIVDTSGTLQELCSIKTKDSTEKFKQILLDGNLLIAIGTTCQSTANKPHLSKIVPVDYNKYFTTLTIYDLSDKKAPQLIRRTCVEGSINKVRKMKDQLYVVASAYRNFVNEDSLTDEKILTYYSDTAESTQELKAISFEDFYYEPWSNCENTTMLAVVPLAASKKASFTAILGSYTETYMNHESLYLTDTSYNWQSNIQTSYISKFELSQEKPVYQASTSVDGKILNAFSMDEYNGNFRIATTNNTGNAIYIFNSQLRQIGALTKLAKGERIYSARFEGDRAYLVTYKETDPLFVFDLSNPRQPKTLGQLKIPGFSQYLHPLGDDLVVGIGRSTNNIIARNEDGEEVITDTRPAGIKLSLFNVKDPQNPVEINHIILGEQGSQSEALENHNAVMVIKEKKMLALPVYLAFNDKESFNGAYVFDVENGKLTGKAKLGRLTDNNSYYQTNSRVCYIDGKMYYIYDDAVNMYSIENFKRLKTIYLKK